MTKKIIISVLGILLTTSCLLQAEEIEIRLMEVIEMGTMPENDPLDGPIQSGNVPTRPTDFRATIDGTTLVVTKQESAISSAQAIVANASTGSIVVNQPFTTSITQQIATPGVYALRIHTAGGDLIGQFIVQ
jgi:hypothetical protein